jgi:hypothetical protein
MLDEGGCGGVASPLTAVFSGWPQYVFSADNGGGDGVHPAEIRNNGEAGLA